MVGNGTALEIAKGIKEKMVRQKKGAAVFYEDGAITTAIRGHTKYDNWISAKPDKLLGVYRPSVPIDDLVNDIEWVTK